MFTRLPTSTTYHTENIPGNHGNCVRFSQREPDIEHSNNVYHVNLPTKKGSNEQTELSLSLSHTHTKYGSTNPGQLNFVQWCLIFVGPRYRTCFLSPFWHLEF